MKLKIVVLVAIAALAATAVGAARADSWCGESSDAACQANLTYVQCSDGTIWLLDQTLADIDSTAQALCGGDYSVLQPAAVTTLSSDTSGGTTTPAWQPSSSGGSDVGLSGDENMAPDPTQYITEVQCPDGQIWAVASGDDFVCPAA